MLKSYSESFPQMILQFASMRWPRVEAIFTQAGMGMLNRFGMSYKVCQWKVSCANVGSNKLRKMLWMKVTGLIEDKTPDQLNRWQAWPGVVDEVVFILSQAE